MKHPKITITPYDFLKISWLVLFVLILSFSSYAHQSTILFCQRIDDLGIDPIHLYPDLIEIVERNGFFLTLGVVPSAFSDYNKNNEELNHHISYIKGKCRTGVIEIGQHGYDHNNININNGLATSEFVGVSYYDQLKKIVHGREILKNIFDIDIKIFIPPFNSYDQLTIKILDSLNYSHLSAKNIALQSEKENRLTYIPYTAGLNSRLEESIRNLIDISDDTLIVCLLLHMYDFKEAIPFYNKLADDYHRPDAAFTFKDYDNLLKTLNSIDHLIPTKIGAIPHSFRTNYSAFNQTIIPKSIFNIPRSFYQSAPIYYPRRSNYLMTKYIIPLTYISAIFILGVISTGLLFVLLREFFKILPIWHFPLFVRCLSSILLVLLLLYNHYIYRVGSIKASIAIFMLGVLQKTIDYIYKRSIPT